MTGLEGVRIESEAAGMGGYLSEVFATNGLTFTNFTTFLTHILPSGPHGNLGNYIIMITPLMVFGFTGSAPWRIMSPPFKAWLWVRKINFSHDKLYRRRKKINFLIYI
jgi:hypothetical protein